MTHNNAPKYNNNNNNNNCRTLNPIIITVSSKNNNYYHIYRHYIEDNQISQICTRPGPNQNPNTTKLNTMGGSIAEKHKAIISLQCKRNPDLHPKPTADPSYHVWQAAGFPVVTKNNNCRGRGGVQQSPKAAMPVMTGWDADNDDTTANTNGGNDNAGAAVYAINMNNGMAEFNRHPVMAVYIRPSGLSEQCLRQ